MWSDNRTSVDAERAATRLSLEDLIAMQPRHVRGPLAPGQRMPGGERLGRGRAQSLEFDGLSPYVIGDDVRWIDWRATARTGRTQMKRFAAESHRARLIVLDLSPALFFGTRTRLMAKTAALLAARLAGTLEVEVDGGVGMREGDAQALRVDARVTADPLQQLFHLAPPQPAQVQRHQQVRGAVQLKEGGVGQQGAVDPLGGVVQGRAPVAVVGVGRRRDIGGADT